MVASNSIIPVTGYTAVLKAKQSEMLAVQTTPPSNFIPLFEVVDPAKAPAIARAWPHKDDVTWVQAINIEGIDDDLWAGETTDLFDALRSSGSAAVPVTTLDESADSLAALNAVITTDQRGLVLRLDCEEALDETPADLKKAIDSILTACGVSADEVDLVVDAGLVEGGVAVQSGVVSAVLAAIPYELDWRNLVTAFSGFPELIANYVHPSSVVALPRTDAAAFNHLRGRYTARDISFADYAVGVPTYADIRWSPIPNIRYALPGVWMIHRAATKLGPSPQYVALANDVVAAAYYAGRSFSPGDANIDDVATGASGPGNAGSHLKSAMSRHFHVVLDSLATHGAP